jgi:hypothetical protein
MLYGSYGIDLIGVDYIEFEPISSDGIRSINLLGSLGAQIVLNRFYLSIIVWNPTDQLRRNRIDLSPAQKNAELKAFSLYDATNQFG